MKILLNGQKHALDQGLSLSDLLNQLGHVKGFAVARNGEFVPRPLYGETLIEAGDEVEIVTPMQGG